MLPSHRVPNLFAVAVQLLNKWDSCKAIHGHSEWVTLCCSFLREDHVIVHKEQAL